MQHNWLLPEYIEDVLPEQAAHIEQLRRQLLDLFNVHGYQLVIPPLLEYTESLMTGTGRDLDLATFKVVDQLTGRLMGVRADITPQAARIDAHMLGNQGVTRLCYAGSVLRTHPDGIAQTRQPLQIGAELFGHAGVESDIEVQQLMVKSLQLAGISDLHVDFGHAAIFETLVRDYPALEQPLHHALQTKDSTEVIALTATIDSVTRNALCALTQLNGGFDMLEKAQTILPNHANITRALNDLRKVAEATAQQGVCVSFDLSELRGYHYHSGIVFAAYAQGFSGALALGGRYDEVGIAFGRARAATGFSIDLRSLIGQTTSVQHYAVLAPALDNAALQLKVAALRESGVRVVQEFAGLEAYRSELKCSHYLVLTDGDWQIVPL